MRWLLVSASHSPAPAWSSASPAGELNRAAEPVPSAEPAEPKLPASSATAQPAPAPTVTETMAWTPGSATKSTAAAPAPASASAPGEERRAAEAQAPVAVPAAPGEPATRADTPPAAVRLRSR